MAKILITLLLSTAILLVAANEACPDPNSIAPCTCDGEGTNCIGKITVDDIRRTFSAKFKYGGTRTIWIQGTGITSIPADVTALIGKLKFQEFHLEVNNVTSMDMGALDASANSLSVLSLFGNQLTTFDFKSLAKLRFLFVLNLARNKLTSIPGDAFGQLPISNLLLAENMIISIGPNAFSKLNNLQRLELGQNRLTTLGPYSFTTPAPNVMINLVANQISHISDTAFYGTNPLSLRLGVNKLTSLPYEVFGPLINRMAVRGLGRSGIDVTYNPLRCCGSDYGWIVQNKQVLQNFIFGFLCTDGRTLQHLTPFNINC